MSYHIWIELVISSNVREVCELNESSFMDQ